MRVAASRNAGTTIGEAAERSGVSAKMIRYYEQTGVFPSASRDSSGYRKYSETDIQLLTLVHHARSLGFSIEEVRSLLELAGRNPRSSASPAALAMAARYRSALAEKMEQIKALDTCVARCLCSHRRSRSRAPDK